MNLTTQNIDHLVAVYVMQPATTIAISTYLGRRSDYANGGLIALQKLGLVERVKAPPGPATTDEERDGFVDGKRKAGKRPYLYRLTATATAAAYHYHQALQALDNRETDHNGHRIGTDPTSAPGITLAAL